MSWVVSKKHRFVFVHIPKTGGTSIADPDYADKKGALIELLGPGDYVQQGHKRAVGLRDEIGSEWDSYFKFSFVRNPWDRLVSLYHYFIQDTEKRVTSLGCEISACKDFSEFCNKMDSMELDPHFDQQISYLIDFDGNYLMDYVGKFEGMQQHFDYICTHLKITPVKLPHYRKSRHQHYKEYYDERAYDIVSRKYEADIRLFGYSF